MKVKIVERHTGSSETLREYVLNKTEGLNRYFDRIISIDAVLSVEKERQIADFHAHLTNRKLIKAQEESPARGRLMFVPLLSRIFEMRHPS